MSFPFLASAVAAAWIVALPLQEPELDTSPFATHLPQELVVVPLDLSTGHPVVQVEIDGRGPFPLFLDTGASGCLIDADLADELGLEAHGQTTMGDPSDPTANLVDLITLPGIALGDAVFEELTAISWARPPGMRTGVARGILGLTTFESCLFTLDYRARQLRIEGGALPAPTSENGIVSFHRRDMGLVSVPLQLPDGMAVDAHLDSGNATTVFVPAAFESKLDVLPGSRRVGRGRRASGDVEFVTARLRGALTVGPVTLEQPELRFDPDMSHANIGGQFLAVTEVTVDLANQRMRLRPFESPGSPGPNGSEAGAPMHK